MKALLLSFLLALLVIAGCSSGGDDKKNVATDDGREKTQDQGGSDNETKGDDDKEQVEIRFTWWGDQARHEVYNGIVDRFEDKYPHIKVKREFGGWTDYWDKLATQTAGGNAPDVVGMHQFYVSDYARRNALLPLEDLVDAGTINLDDFPQSTIDSGKVEGDLFMIAQGITMPGWAFNTATFDELGIEYPDMNWTWEDLIAKGKEIKAALESKDKYAFSDLSGGGLQPNFRYFVRERGKDIFTDDGKLAFETEDLVDWWTMWDDLRQQGIIPDAATSNEFEGVPLEQSMYVTGKTLLHQIPANQIYLYQQQFDEGEIRMVRMPTMDGGEPGEYIEGAYLSITKESEHPEEAAMFIDFFINTEAAAELFKVEQGPPGSKVMSEFVKPLLDPAQQRAVSFIQETVDYARPAPYAPLGINEVEQIFSDYADAIAFGQMGVEEAAENFMSEAKGILGD